MSIPSVHETNRYFPILTLRRAGILLWRPNFRTPILSHQFLMRERERDYRRECEHWACGIKRKSTDLPINAGDVNDHVNHITTQFICLHIYWTAVCSDVNLAAYVKQEGLFNTRVLKSEAEKQKRKVVMDFFLYKYHSIHDHSMQPE